VTRSGERHLYRFCNINIGGLRRDGSDGSNVISHMLLEIVDDMHLLQPSKRNISCRRKPPTPS